MFLKFFKRMSVKSQTRRELQSMSDRDLADIGIKRYDIERILAEL